MVPLSGRGSAKRGMWRPTKEEIGQWLDMKEIDFVVDQNKNP